MLSSRRVPAAVHTATHKQAQLKLMRQCSFIFICQGIDISFIMHGEVLDNLHSIKVD